MSDADDRLAGLDPAANQPYHHADLDAMISRIVATPAMSQRARWQRFQARLAGGAIAATLATALTLVATQGSPSLPALAIQRALTGPSASFATQVPMNTYEDLHFRTSSGISSHAPMVDSYKLSLPASNSAETARLAAIFGVSGVPAAHGTNNWTVTSAAGAVLNYDGAGVPQWYYSSSSPKVAPAEESGSVSVAMPSHATVQSDARRYVGELDFNYTLGAPQFSTATTSSTTPNGAPLTVYSETVSYPVVVHRATTGQSISFTVDPTNTLVYAEGPAFSVGPGVSYPLQSPLEGVAALGTAEKRSLAGAAAALPARAIVTRASVSLAPYRLKNHQLWLLPLYTYSGSVKELHHSTIAARTWSELAVAPTYVAGSSATSEGVSN
jgi:hypothetical protein